MFVASLANVPNIIPPCNLHRSLNIMEEPRKFILDRFQEHLQVSFETFCDRHGVEKSHSQLVTYLIDHDLIISSHLQRYTILRELDHLRATGQNYPKTQIVNTLSNRFSISERTVYTILKYDKISKK